MGPEYFWMGGMWMFPIIVVVLLVVIALIFFSKNGKTPSCWKPDGSSNNESALDLLKKRYASGEITKEEFEEIKKDIK